MRRFCDAYNGFSKAGSQLTIFMRYFILQELSLSAKSGGNWLANSRAGMRGKGEDRACRKMSITVAGCSAVKEMG